VVESLTAILSIVVINLVLSGDNAVVIGMASRSLSQENRRKAIVFGGAGAVGLRILFTALAARALLGIPYLQAIGGVLLVYIAYKLLRPQSDHGAVREAVSLREAIQTIILADLVMSLDNILAVAGAAQQDTRLLIFGLVLSIPIILFGSELVARLLGRFPAFLYFGALVLVHAAIEMILHDPALAGRFFAHVWQLWEELALSLAITAAIVGIVRMLERTNGERDIRVAPTGADPLG
jgi:YjbE family integral membrane protein